MALTLVALAQNAEEGAKIPPPREPVLPRTPDCSEWTIITRVDLDEARQGFINPSKAGQSASKDLSAGLLPFPVKTIITKNGKTYRENITWSDGRSTEKWIFDGLELRESRNGDRVLRVASTDLSRNFSDYSRSDFEDLEWIGLDNYVGVKMVAGRSVYEFAVDGAKKRPTPRETAAGTNEGTTRPPRRLVAYLDAETQLPLYLDDGHTISLYSYSSSPPRDLVPPEKFRAEFTLWKESLNPQPQLLRRDLSR